VVFVFIYQKKGKCSILLGLSKRIYKIGF